MIKPRSACRNGHPYTEGSWRRRSDDGTRICMVCQRAWTAARTEHLVKALKSDIRTALLQARPLHELLALVDAL